MPTTTNENNNNNESERMARAIALHRVSTDAQDVARQRADTERGKPKFHIEIERVLELVGVSGTATLQNDQIQQILADLVRPDIDGIFVSSLDRLFRPKEFATFGILDPFVKQRKRIWSMREGEIEPWTDRGFDLCITAGGRAGSEWREIQRRTMDGRIENCLKLGIVEHGSTPYAYRYVNKHMPGGRRWEIIEEQAEVVRMVYAWRRSGWKTYTIAKKLNELNIPSRGYNGKAPGMWGRRVIIQMLQNPSYMGEHKRFGYTIPVPAIVDADLWNEVQGVNQKARAMHQGPPAKHEYLLRELLYCGRCGRRYITCAWTNPRYRCGNFTAKPPYQRHCDAPSVTQKAIEEAAWAEVWRVLSSKDVLMGLARAYVESLDIQESVTEQRERELAKLQRKLAVTKDMIRDGLMEYSEGRIDLLRLQAEIKQLTTEIKVNGKIITLPPTEAIEAAVRQVTEDIAEGVEPSTYQARRSILEGILDLKMTYHDGQLTIEGKIPMPDSTESTTSNGNGKRPKSPRNCEGHVNPLPSSAVTLPFKIKTRVA